MHQRQMGRLGSQNDEPLEFNYSRPRGFGPLSNLLDLTIFWATKTVVHPGSGPRIAPPAVAIGDSHRHVVGRHELANAQEHPWRSRGGRGPYVADSFALAPPRSQGLGRIAGAHLAGNPQRSDPGSGRLPRRLRVCASGGDAEMHRSRRQHGLRPCRHAHFGWRAARPMDPRSKRTAT